MSQVGYTPILLYGSTTAGNTPSAANMTTSSSGVELAINAYDGKLFYKDASGNVQVLAGKGGTGVVAGSNTQIQFNNNGVFGASSSLTWDGTYLTAGSIKDSALTSGRVTYAGASGLLQDSTNLTFDGTTLTANALTVSNAVTLSGGTANGVAYLNGSKVLTTGSALTFDGTNFGIGLATPSGYGISPRAYVQQAADTAWKGLVIGAASSDAFLGVYYDGSTFNYSASYGSTAGYKPMAWQVGGSEQMRLTSTGLGIGTSSPSSKLTISGAAATGATTFLSTGTTTNYNVGQFTNTGGSFYFGLDNNAGTAFSGSSAYGGIVGTGNATFLGLVTNGTVRATIDSSGNLGLGVTPSAGAVWVNFQTQRAVITGGANDRNETSYNSYRTSGQYTYIGSDYASIYQQTSGQHRWFTAPSGTAGNAISFTQAMTLDASGNLGVGVTNPSQRLDLLNASGTDATIRMRSGTENGYIEYTSANAMRFLTNSTERARIDASGNLLVGTTTSSGAPNQGFCLIKDFGVGGASGIAIGHLNSSSGALYANFSYNGSGIGSISQNGTTGVLYNLTSDYRLKNNPVALTGSGAFIDALQPKTWDWWDGSGKGVGFIAHEFMEVAKYSGNGEKDAVDADGKPVYQSIQPSSSEVMANLVAEIQSLRKRLAAAGIA